MYYFRGNKLLVVLTVAVTINLIANAASAHCELDHIFHCIKKLSSPLDNGKSSGEAAAQDTGKTLEKSAPDTGKTATFVLDDVRASRVFAGPGQYPPTKFAAYGILAFRSQASDFDRERHKMICEAYVNSIPHVVTLEIDSKDQMDTVWPVDTDQKAIEINAVKKDRVCKLAIDAYGLVIAKANIKAAEAAGWQSDGIGPFLLAWSPPSNRGNSDAIVLSGDLSNVTTYSRALNIMKDWVKDIEKDPELWRCSGWCIEKLRLVVQRWLGDYGAEIMSVVGPKG